MLSWCYIFVYFINNPVFYASFFNCIISYTIFFTDLLKRFKNLKTINQIFVTYIEFSTIFLWTFLWTKSIIFWYFFATIFTIIFLFLYPVFFNILNTWKLKLIFLFIDNFFCPFRDFKWIRFVMFSKIVGLWMTIRTKNL